jgi:DNA recombination protein RmuC
MIPWVGYFFVFVFGCLLGGVVSYAWRSARIGQLSVKENELIAKLSTAEALLAAERLSREALSSEFKDTAATVLETATRQIVSEALKDFRQVKTESDIGVAQMQSKLEGYQKTVQKFEEERSEMYGRLERSLGQVLNAEQSIRMETSALKKALTSSAGVRGVWGEKILTEILEQNQFVRGINFDTQVMLSDDEEARSRPDFVIYLPGGKKMIIDSKEVAGEYLLAQETDDAAKQKEHYAKLVTNIRSNMLKLSRKEYQSLLDPDIPFVVMFIPSEAAIRAAFATNPEIFDEAAKYKVILASPMTVIPLIYLVKHAWQQQKVAENARVLNEVVEELGDRLYKFVEHLHTIRNGLKKATEGWDKASSSWQRKISPQIDRIKALGGKWKDQEELEALETEAKLLSDKHESEV